MAHARVWSDGQVVAVAAAAWVGAAVARPVPVSVAGLGLALSARVAGAAAPRSGPRLRHRCWLVAAVVAGVVSLLAGRSLEGLRPVDEGPFEGPVVLLGDPESAVSGTVRVDVRAPGGVRLVAAARGRAAALLLRAETGDVALVQGTTGPLGGAGGWMRARHLRGSLQVTRVAATGSGSRAAEAASGFRHLLDRGARSLPPDRRALLLGLVLGDDRGQPPELVSDFRASGLTHLLAVSGQNVAFAMVVVGPLLRRLRLWPRLVVAAACVLAFAFVTRLEPSVLRASAVAVVGLAARTVGRSSGGVRHLALGVLAIVAIDPMLVWSVGFRLSVAASAGVLVLAPLVAQHLRGPRWLVEALSVTVGAQLAVAPVLVPAFGPLPLAAIPSNLLAAPVAGALMVWGLSAGALAGVVDGPAAALLHLPTGAGTWWLEHVAAWAAGLPVGGLGVPELLVVAIGSAVAVRARRRTRPGVGRAAVAAVAVAVASPLVQRAPAGPSAAGHAATVWVDGPVAVLDISSGASAALVLDELRRRHVRTVGLVVVRTGRSDTVEVLDAVAERFPPSAVLGPPGVAWRGALEAVPDLRLVLGRLLVRVGAPGPPLRVHIGWRPP